MKPLRVVVTIVEGLTAAAVVVFVVMLFANEPATEVVVDPSVDDINGAGVFADNCASCHGAEGEGGLGPTLAGGAVVEAFPDAADQVVVVTDGQGGMPAFGDRLSAEEIDAVVEFTRTGLP